MRLRIRHTKLGKIRFTSHRDTANHWERAVRKSGVRLSYSGGFTPRPRMSFGLALPTGGESLAEYLDIELADDDHDLADLCGRFGAALPIGYDVTRVMLRDDGGPSLQEDVVACTWQIALSGVDETTAREAVDRTLALTSLRVERERKGQRRTDDVRVAIEDLSIVAVDDDERPHLCAVLANNGRALRPIEMVAAIFPALDAVDTTARVLRTHQWIERDGRRREIIPVESVAPRTHVACA